MEVNFPIKNETLDIEDKGNFAAENRSFNLCDFCGKVYFTEKNLLDHKQSHKNEEKPKTLTEADRLLNNHVASLFVPLPSKLVKCEERISEKDFQADSAFEMHPPPVSNAIDECAQGTSNKCVKNENLFESSAAAGFSGAAEFDFMTLIKEENTENHKPSLVKSMLTRFSKDRADKGSESYLPSTSIGVNNGLGGELSGNKKIDCSFNYKNDGVTSADQELINGKQSGVFKTPAARKCPTCGKLFFERKKFLSHKLNHKRNKKSGKHPFDKGTSAKEVKPKSLHETKQPGKKKQSYVCQVCGKKFEKKRTFINHKTNHNVNKKTAKCLFFDRSSEKRTAAISRPRFGNK